MELEKEINQKKFKNEYEKALINVLFTGNWLNAINNRFLKQFDPKLTAQQYNVLRILRGRHPHKITLNDIQCRMLDRMSNASRLVDKLKERRLVERKESALDRRKVDIWITKDGLKVLEEIDENFTQIFQYLERITPQEAKELNKILDKIRG